MSILEVLNKRDRFASANGIQLVEVTPGRAVTQLTVTQKHLNGGDVCQGGALFTLADLAIAAVMNEAGQLTFGIQNSIMFLSSAREGDVLQAEATCIFDHHKIPTVEVRITSQDSRLICHVTGVGYRKSTPLPGI